MAGYNAGWRRRAAARGARFVDLLPALVVAPALTAMVAALR